MQRTQGLTRLEGNNESRVRSISNGWMRRMCQKRGCEERMTCYPLKSDAQGACERRQSQSRLVHRKDAGNGVVYVEPKDLVGKRSWKRSEHIAMSNVKCVRTQSFGSPITSRWHLISPDWRCLVSGESGDQAHHPPSRDRTARHV